MSEAVSTYPAADEIVFRLEGVRAVRRAIDTLPDREALAVMMRHGIGCTEHTFKDIGSVLGISVERARQVVLRAQRRLMHPAKGLHRFKTGIRDLNAPKNTAYIPISPRVEKAPFDYDAFFWGKFQRLGGKRKLIANLAVMARTKPIETMCFMGCYELLGRCDVGDLPLPFRSVTGDAGVLAAINTFAPQSLSFSDYYRIAHEAYLFLEAQA